ncbi:hypothetical protein [Protaetiibacter intestinalis]|uniref:Uncharacterized protein n=1 Tax=Protaetiibacter intestinalis TaxID=2419774 RepID=A0A387B9F5_9MICO|nr:hypothetical protein [Protaetiibacter intestinalis]AYF97736.1 hypothetical protein D7I47_05360 [Protaetiibacter intestinalis]
MSTPERDEDDETVVVDRAVPAPPADEEPEAEDHTVVVEREDDATVAVERSGSTTGEHTVAVPVDSEGAPLQPAPAETSLGHDSGSLSPVGPKLARPAGARRRGELRPAPVPAGFGRTATRAVGAGAVLSYAPAEVAAAQATAQPIAAAAEATRFRAPSMPSVLRSSRRAAVTAVVVLAGACVVSIGGLAAVIVFLVTTR